MPDTQTAGLIILFLSLALLVALPFPLRRLWSAWSSRRRMRHQAATHGVAPADYLDLRQAIALMDKILAHAGDGDSFRSFQTDVSYAAKIVGRKRYDRRILMNAYLETMRGNSAPAKRSGHRRPPLVRTRPRPLPQPRSRWTRPALSVAGSALWTPKKKSPLHEVNLPGSSDTEPPTVEEASAVAPTSAKSLDHALAVLFIRLGPPPEPAENDYAPASNGGGGAQQ